MEQSPTISLEQDSSSITISRDSSEKSLVRFSKLEKWQRMTKRVIRLLRYMNIRILRLRFLDMIRHLSIEDFEFEDLKKVPEDLAFLDDVQRYREVANTLTSFGFLWQDKEFRLAKLKANYIYDHYMSSPDILAKTNIPADTIPSIANRMNSPRIYPSLTYLNLFNDAEKFLREKLLSICIRTNWNGLSSTTEKPVIPRYRGNRMTEQSVVASEQSKEIKNIEKSIVDAGKMKTTIEPQYDEILIPNWTYSTSSGVVYNPIREKSFKTTKKLALKKTKTLSSNIHPILEVKARISNDKPQLHSNSIPHIYRDPTAQPSSEFNFLSTSPYSRCDHVFKKNIFDRQRISPKIFICKTHCSSFNSLPNRSIIRVPYRMAFPLQLHPLFRTTHHSSSSNNCRRSISSIDNSIDRKIDILVKQTNE